MQLHNIDPEDMEDVLARVQSSFGIRFHEIDLQYVNTFGDLCDLVISKLRNLHDANDCTSQQAFYKLRDSIASVMSLDKQVITPKSELKQVIPPSSRRSTMRKIETHLGFRLNLLRPPYYVTAAISAIAVASLVGLFFVWQISILGLVSCMLAGVIANIFANTFIVTTVGEAADKMSCENYLNSRRDPGTVNRAEIENKIRELFAKELMIPESTLSKDASFK